MFTPEPASATTAHRVAPPFPTGDISFMHGINPNGTKILNPESLGSMGQKNIYSNRRKRYAKELVLYFNFTGENKTGHKQSSFTVKRAIRPFCSFGMFGIVAPGKK